MAASVTAVAHHAGSSVAAQADPEAAGEHRREPDVVRRFVHEAARQDVVDDAGVNLNAGEVAGRERRLEDVEQAGTGGADKDRLVLEHRGIDLRLHAGLNLLLGILEVEK